MDDIRVKDCDGHFSDEELREAILLGELQYKNMDFKVVPIYSNEKYMIGYETIPNNADYKENLSKKIYDDFVIKNIRIIKIEEA